MRRPTAAARNRRRAPGNGRDPHGQSPTRPPRGIHGNPPQARIGAYGGIGLFGQINTTADGVVYFVQAIVLRGPDGRADAIRHARAAHRYMIVSAAELARRLGHWTFRLRGMQAGFEFRTHADRLARTVGIVGSGMAIEPDYEVALVVAKVLA
jgi:hypothetical protein